MNIKLCSCTIYIHGVPDLNVKPKRGDSVDLNCHEKNLNEKFLRCLEIEAFKCTLELW